MEHLRFKETRQEEEWESGRLPKKLVEVVSYIVARRWELLREDTVVTCIFRTMAENKALGAESLTHVEWRAVDLRVNAGQLFTEMEIRQEVNGKFPTGVKQMPRVPPLDHGTALHYHVQISRAEAVRRG